MPLRSSIVFVFLVPAVITLKVIHSIIQSSVLVEIEQ